MKFNKINKIINIFILIITFIFVSGCSNNVLMNPKGIIGIEERSLILTSLGLMLIIVVPVIFMTIIFAIKYRQSNNKAKYCPNWSHSNKIEFIVWIIPIIIIILLASITWKSTHNLDPNKPIISSNKYIIIQVIAMDWKWLFIYPKQNIASINEIYFPINVPIKFEITSNSVMNSFFIPQLGSQIYAMTGMNSNLNLIANEPGIYKGFSSNFSGEGFSGMKFIVVATKNQKIFNQWVKKVKNSKNKLNNYKKYEKLELPSKYCSVEYFSDIKKNLYQEILMKHMNATKNYSVSNKI